MYAVVEILGKQYKAEKGKKLTVDLCGDAKEGDMKEFPVLLLANGKDCKVGAPYVEGAKVQVQVADSFRDKKVSVFKYQKRKAYHKTIGHRQSYTNVIVKDIIG
ncbi:MAG: 50S ribosomal protein L21 [Spirochaetia bacterium]